VSVPTEGIAVPRRLPYLLALLALALLPAAAPAKEIARAEVCGADGCHAIAGNGAAGHDDDRWLLTGYGPRANLPATVGGYYLIRVYMRVGPDTGTQAIVARWFPDDRLVAADSEVAGRTAWMLPDGTTLAALRRVTRGVPALPPSLVPAAVLGDVRPSPAPPAPKPDDGGTPAWPFALGAGLALAAAAAVAGLRRRRKRPAGAPLPGR
jgi:hypothetical protein